MDFKNLGGKKLFIAVPCYGGNMHGACALSLLQLDQALRALGVDVKYEMLYNESLISRARNILVDCFLKSDCTHMLFVDSDIQFLHVDIIRMLDCDKDVIGGLYAKKEILWERIAKCAGDGLAPSKLVFNTSGFVFWPTDEFLANNNKELPVDQPIEVRYVGTGLMMIRRNVFEEIMKNNPVKWYLYKNDKHYCFFDCVIRDHVYLSEDYYFCETWRMMNGKIFAAIWTRTVHYGTLGLFTDVSQMS